ncbi:hypothetical protein LOTGIDRAFT_231772 [Lottia gigantea]|uniref:Glycoside hydrolase family 49 N-terminal domain-containing protein n=1 Tax=Lottia gigantea TaxID=225164 RepID=V3ZZP6_LOTGI|nr:hypothetical protein LOTGIDRAFT_231772 [Lottia gigantea]ESO97028.1 hypothetical protein LOTGIDRAFT_231772 [Lottia gigantea]
MLVALILLFQQIVLGTAELIVYPVATGYIASDKFSVQIKQGSEAFQDSFVYISHSNNRVGQDYRVRPDRTLSWSSFGFTECPVLVIVVTNRDFNECLVRPKSYGITCSKTGEKAASFEMTSNTQKISVEFDYDYGGLHSDIVDKLLIFANPQETNVPDRTDPNVIYYESGVYNLHGPLELRPNIRHVYLAPGAVVHGGFKTSRGQSVTISGRGILSGSKYEFKDRRFPWALVDTDEGSNHTVEGITMVDPMNFFYRGLSSFNVLRNIKTVAAWTHHSAGAALGPHGLIEDSFFHDNDDSIKAYNTGLIVRRCVIWQSQNGAVFQFGWWVQRRARDISISDIDVIHTDWCTFKNQNCGLSPNNAILNVGRRTKFFSVTNVTISDVRVEGQCPRIFYFVLEPMATGTLTNFHLNRWSIESQPETTMLYNELRGSSGGRLQNWFFDNITIAGQCIDNPTSANIRVDPNTRSDIYFRCSQ